MGESNPRHNHQLPYLSHNGDIMGINSIIIIEYGDSSVGIPNGKICIDFNEYSGDGIDLDTETRKELVKELKILFEKYLIEKVDTIHFDDQCEMCGNLYVDGKCKCVIE